jgi:hypothetical protein
MECRREESGGRDLIAAALAFARSRLPAEVLREHNLRLELKTDDGDPILVTTLFRSQLLGGEVVAGPAPTAPPVEAVLTDTQEAIEAVLRLADKPIKVATIASRANKVFNSHFRAEMGRLRRAGRVVVTPEHRYWLADRGKPPA